MVVREECVVYAKIFIHFTCSWPWSHWKLNARLTLLSNFDTGTQNLAADAGITSQSNYASDIVVTNQYQAEGVTFLPANTSGGPPGSRRYPRPGNHSRTGGRSHVWHVYAEWRVRYLVCGFRHSDRQRDRPTYTAVGTASTPSRAIIGSNNGFRNWQRLRCGR